MQVRWLTFPYREAILQFFNEDTQQWEPVPRVQWSHKKDDMGIIHEDFRREES